MVRKTCDKELSAIQKLKLENKELREKNSKLSHFIKHNRHKLSNPDAAEEILNKCSSEKEILNNNPKENSSSNDNTCPQCHKKKFFEKRFTLPNKTIMIWKQCSEPSCSFKTESKIEKNNEIELVFS